MLVEPADPVRVKFIVEQRTFAADEMRVEVTPLDAIDDHAHLPIRPPPNFTIVIEVVR